MERKKVQCILKRLADTANLQTVLPVLIDECGELSKKDSFGWALIAKLVYVCDQEFLKVISGRIQKKLIVSTRQPISRPLLHFIRSFLVRFPWLKAFNEHSLASLCSRAVDYAVENYDSVEIGRLSCDIYALWAGNKYDHVLVRILKNTLNDVIIQEKGDSEKDILYFQTANRRFLTKFVAMIFTLHRTILEQSASGDEIAINDWLDVACTALAVDDPEIDKSIFRWLKTFLLRARSCAHCQSRRISALIADFCRPSEAYYETVKSYIQLGPTSNVDTLFKVLTNEVSNQLHSQEFGVAYAEAVGSMIELRSYMLNIQDIVQLQHVVCLEAFMNRNCKPALSLMNSLLAMNHELIPSPIQIAQSIFCNTEDRCTEVRLGQALCLSISRPRIQTFVPQERILKKLYDAISDMQTHHEDSTNLLDSSNHEGTADSSHTSSLGKEVDDGGIMDELNPENYSTGKAENIEKRREHVVSNETALKRVRINSDHEQAFISSSFEVKEPLNPVEISNAKEQFVGKEKNNLLGQRKSDTASVINMNYNSTGDVNVGGNIDDEELSVQQMMADFVPM